MIVPMKRLTLIAMKSDEDAILAALQSIGAVEIDNKSDAAGDDALLSRLEGDVARYKSAYGLLGKYAEKKGLAPKPEATVDELTSSLEDAKRLCGEVEAFDRELASIKNEREKRSAMIDALTPWAELDSNIEDIAPTKNVKYLTGIIATNELPLLDELDAAVEVFPGERRSAVLIAASNDEYSETQTFLKTLTYSEFNFPKLTGTPKHNIASLKKEIESFDADEARVIAALAEAGKKRDELGRGFDAASIERDREKAKTELSTTVAAFMIEGWIRSDEEQLVNDTVAKVTDVFYFETRDVLPDENPPSVTKNSKLIEPYESITEMYARPSYRGIDAAPILAPFYFLFFGMMLSDSGYGLVLFIGGMLYSKFLKPQGNTAKLTKVITMGGLSALICGPFIGSFFGLDWNTVFGTTGVFPLLFDPMHDVMEMMILSCGLGLIHMYTGIIVKIYMCFRDGDPMSAICDNLSWMLLLTGIIMIFVVPSLNTVALILVAVGGGLLLFFSNRSTKNPFKRIGSGLGTLYNITGYLSDILSYVRIFALGLVSGAMGMVFNLIGGLVSDALGGLGVVGVIIGTILAAAILVALHLFSLFINTLGAYAHCARLQFIEFFGKFYEADGTEFKPLKYTTKHNIVKKGAGKTAQ